MCTPQTLKNNQQLSKQNHREKYWRLLNQYTTTTNNAPLKTDLLPNRMLSSTTITLWPDSSVTRGQPNLSPAKLNTTPFRTTFMFAIIVLNKNIIIMSQIWAQIFTNLHVKLSHNCKEGLIAQWLEHPLKRKVPGSNPGWAITFWEISLHLGVRTMWMHSCMVQISWNVLCRCMDMEYSSVRKLAKRAQLDGGSPRGQVASPLSPFCTLH